MIQQNKHSPLGIFDSGLGGLSILSEIHKRLPDENIIYYADSNNAPYGEKTKEEIIELSIRNTEYLLSKGSKIIVVACNTATTNAIGVLREKFEVPFIGIEPAIKPAALSSKTHQIGVLATKGTLSSQLFHDNAERFRQIKILEIEGKGIVEAIENNTTHTKAFQEHLYQQMVPLLHADIDYLVLGCSHYPFIIHNLEEIFGNRLQLIDSGFAVAKQTQRILNESKLENNSTKTHMGSINIYTNGTSPDALQAILRKLNLNDCQVF